jgi:hypothetical protein
MIEREFDFGEAEHDAADGLSAVGSAVEAAAFGAATGRRSIGAKSSKSVIFRPGQNHKRDAQSRQQRL